MSTQDPAPEPGPEEEVGQVADEANQEVAPAHVGTESEVEQELEERASLSEKERRNEEVNERDNCSASSISSSSSTLEREEKEDKLPRDRGTGNQAPFSVNIPGDLRWESWVAGF